MCAHLSMLVAKQIVHVFTLSKRQLEMSDGSLRERCGQTAEAITVLQPWVPVEPHEWQVQYWVWWGEWMAEPWRAHILGVGGGVVSKKLELSPNWGGAQGIQWWCPCDGGCWACPCDCVNMSLCHGPDPNGNIEPPPPPLPGVWEGLCQNLTQLVVSRRLLLIFLLLPSLCKLSLVARSKDNTPMPLSPEKAGFV